MEIGKLLIENVINMLDEIIECSHKNYKYPFSITRIREAIDELVFLLEEGD